MEVNAKAYLEPILFAGKYEHRFELGPYSILFNLASVGEIADTIAAFMPKTENDVKAAKIASSLVSVNNYTFAGNAGNSLSEKYSFIRSLQGPVFDFFWDSFQVAVNLQYKIFEDTYVNGKKSSPTQNSEATGDSTKYPE